MEWEGRRVVVTGGASFIGSHLVDRTGRVQTVSKEHNLLYWQVIEEFEKLTRVPVLLNTSFNENEPIVCTPKEALDCFLRTKMDVLVMGNYVVEKGPEAKRAPHAHPHHQPIFPA